MGVPANFRGDIRPFVEAANGQEIPAVFVVGGTVSLSRFGNEGSGLVVDESGALVFTEWAHYQVHMGEMMHAEHSFSGVANNADVYIRLLAGAKHIHTVWFVGNGGQCLLYLYEAPNINGGTAVPIWNMNRNSAHVAAAQVFHTPNIVATGTNVLVNGRLLPGGTTGGSRVGGGVRQGTEWELKPSTEYLFRVNNNSGGAIGVSVGVEFYEEET